LDDNVPRLRCVDKAKEKQLSAMLTVKNLGTYNFVGNFDLHQRRDLTHGL